MTDPKQILEASKTILLVDWPNAIVPRTLLEAGLIVFGYSPYHYSRAEIVPDLPKDVNPNSVFPPKNENEKGHLVFHRLDKPPAEADIVSIYRPANELPGILAEHVLPLGAKVVWLQRSAASSEQSMIEKNNLVFIANNDIVAIARTLQKNK